MSKIPPAWRLIVGLYECAVVVSVAACIHMYRHIEPENKHVAVLFIAFSASAAALPLLWMRGKDQTGTE